MRCKQWFSGFFKAQLLNRKLRKSKSIKSSKRGTLNSIDTQLCCSYPISNKHEGNKMSICPQLCNNMPNIYNTHRGKGKMKMTLFNDHLPILKKHRGMLENKGRQIDDLSEDLLAGILVRLPVKYILRCRCVKKSWYYLIQTPRFINLHLNQQKTIARNPNPKYLYFNTRYTSVLTIRFDDVQCPEYCKIKYPPGLPKAAWRRVSNGLICTATFLYCGRLVLDNNIYLWNPLVEKYKTLPDSPLPFGESETKWKALAFGFVPEINDYVVVHVVKPCLHLARGERDPHSVLIGVYSLKANSWKKLSQDNVFARAIRHEDAVFINGAAFWIGISLDYRKVILCYDTKTDMLREISLPKCVKHRPLFPVIHPFGQSSLAYFLWDRKDFRARRNDYFEMWVLKYDSVDEISWEKKMSINPNEDIREIVFKDTRVEVLGVRNNGEPILARLFDLVSYDLDNNEANDFVDSWDSWTPYPYYERDFAPPFFICPFVESLALLNID